MSIYPRIVKQGELVNLHVRLTNNEEKVLESSLSIEIKGGNEIFNISRKIKLKPGVSNFYFKISPNEIGRYIVKTTILIRNVKIKSKTFKTDFFEVTS